MGKGQDVQKVDGWSVVASLPKADVDWKIFAHGGLVLAACANHSTLILRNGKFEPVTAALQTK